ERLARERLRQGRSVRRWPVLRTRAPRHAYRRGRDRRADCALRRAAAARRRDPGPHVELGQPPAACRVRFCDRPRHERGGARRQPAAHPLVRPGPQPHPRTAAGRCGPRRRAVLRRRPVPPATRGRLRGGRARAAPRRAVHRQLLQPLLPDQGGRDLARAGRRRPCGPRPPLPRTRGVRVRRRPRPRGRPRERPAGRGDRPAL
ncbi:MAG: AT4g29590/T16L4_100, partial [uncultured Sphingomonadaceae bacterium]